jgi:hypothetical protein
MDVNELDVKRENYNLFYNLLRHKIGQKSYITAKQLNLDPEYIRSMLMECLLGAIDRWDVTKKKNCKFTSFFWKRCNLAILNETAKVRTTKNSWGRRSKEPAIYYVGHVGSINPIGDSDNDEGTNVEHTKEAMDAAKNLWEDRVEDIVSFRDTINKLLAISDYGHKQVLIQLYKAHMTPGKDDSLSGIARSLGVSPSCVRNRLSKLRELYNARYED